MVALIKSTPLKIEHHDRFIKKSAFLEGLGRSLYQIQVRCEKQSYTRNCIMEFKITILYVF